LEAGGASTTSANAALHSSASSSTVTMSFMAFFVLLAWH
jgi:hypothetical protein